MLGGNCVLSGTGYNLGQAERLNKAKEETPGTWPRDSEVEAPDGYCCPHPTYLNQSEHILTRLISKGRCTVFEGFRERHSKLFYWTVNS